MYKYISVRKEKKNVGQMPRNVTRCNVTDGFERLMAEFSTPCLSCHAAICRQHHANYPPNLYSPPVIHSAAHVINNCPLVSQFCDSILSKHVNPPAIPHQGGGGIAKKEQGLNFFELPSRLGLSNYVSRRLPIYGNGISL